MKVIDGQSYYSIKDVASMVSVHRATIDNYIRRGIITPDIVLEPYKDGRPRGQFFKQDTVLAFLKSCGLDGMPDDELLSSGDVAKLLGVSPSSLKYRFLHSDLKADCVLPPILKGKFGQRRFKRSTALEYAKNRPINKHRVM